MKKKKSVPDSLPGKVQLDPLNWQSICWLITQTDVTTGEKQHSVGFE